MICVIEAGEERRRSNPVLLVVSLSASEMSRLQGTLHSYIPVWNVRSVAMFLVSTSTVFPWLRLALGLIKQFQ
jgi:hypothetical protein